VQHRFGFHLPTRIEFGHGLLIRLGELVISIARGKKVFIVTDAGIEKAGLLSPVLSSLEKENFSYLIFNRVKPNPRDMDCEIGGEEAKSFGADLIVALGGGSVIDSAKAIALLHSHGGPLKAFEGKGKVTEPVIPIVAVPTTAGTGSEVTRSAVITDIKRKFKMTVKDIMLAPKLAIVDPETTYSLPAELTASTGMDAFVHALEAYTCRESNPFADIFALAAIEKIYPALLPAVEKNDRSARDDLMLGSLLAGLAFSHADVAAVHCMAEAVGGLYDIPHGVANSIFLPYVTSFNFLADPVKHAKVAETCGLPVKNMEDRAAAELLITDLKKLSRKIGIPAFSSFKDIVPADFPRLAEASVINGSTSSNCREIKEKDYLDLFQAAYDEGK